MRSGTSLVKFVVVALMGVIAVTVLFVGRRPGKAEDAPPPDFVVVEYWEKWTGNEGTQMKSIVDDFNRTVGREKKIFVRFVNTSQIDRKTLIATAAGVPPDIAGVWDNTLPQLVALEALMPLDELAREHGIAEGFYKPVYWRHCVFKGKLMALISTPATIALHINAKIVRENADKLRAAGLDPDVPPRSIAELDAWAKALDVLEPLGNGQNRIIRAGYLPGEPGWYLGQTPYWFGSQTFDDRTGAFTLTDPAVVRAFDWAASYTRRLGFNAVTNFRASVGNFDSPQNAFMAGQVVMVQQGPWMANYIRSQMPSLSGVKPGEKLEDEVKLPLSERLKKYDWIVVPFPSEDGKHPGATYAAFDAMVIPRGARHPREAFEFIAYVNRQDVHEKLNMLHCKNSALSNVSEQFLEHHPNPYIKVFEELARSPNARGVPNLAINAVAVEEIGNVIQNIIRLEAEPQAGLQASQGRLTEKLKQFQERAKRRAIAAPSLAAEASR